jgi:hypothetical protein
MTPAVSDEVSGHPNPRVAGPGPDKVNRAGRKGGRLRPQRKRAAHSRAPPLRLIRPKYQFPVALATSTETPGPIVEEMETFFM